MLIAATQSCREGHLDTLKHTLVELNLVDTEPDLFDHVELLPSHVQAILVDYSLDEVNATTLADLENRLREVGYTFDWGLAYEPMNLREVVPQISVEDADEDLIENLSLISDADKHKAILTVITAIDTDDMEMVKDALVDYRLLSSSPSMSM